jgi:hypothetical protein
MSLRKSFIKPRSGAGGQGLYGSGESEVRKYHDVSMPYGRKHSAMSIEVKENHHASFSIGGRKLALPGEGRRPSNRGEPSEIKKPTLGRYRPPEGNSFGSVSNSNILANEMAKKPSMK